MDGWSVGRSVGRQEFGGNTLLNRLRLPDAWMDGWSVGRSAGRVTFFGPHFGPVQCRPELREGHLHSARNNYKIPLEGRFGRL